MKVLNNSTLYKKTMKDTTEMGITLTTNADGAKVFNCNITSLWPIQCAINELSNSKCWANILVGGLWFGKGNPDMIGYLEVFVQEGVEGGTVKWESGNNKVESNIPVIYMCVHASTRCGGVKISPLFAWRTEARRSICFEKLGGSGRIASEPVLYLHKL